MTRRILLHGDDDLSRVLVTVRCRRKGHVLAELAVTADGVRFIRTRHHRAVSGPDGHPETGVSDFLAGDPRATVTVRCACGRRLMTLADLEAAEKAGKPVVTVDPATR